VTAKVAKTDVLKEKIPEILGKLGPSTNVNTEI
jgi:hypothetical protein